RCAAVGRYDGCPGRCRPGPRTATPRCPAARRSANGGPVPASNRPESDHGTTPAPASPEHVSDAREEVLSRVRAALADTPAAPLVPRHYRRDLAGPDGSGRRRGHATLTDLLNRFVERVIDYRATVARVSPAGLAPTVAD